jgi:hypothetical protein
MPSRTFNALKILYLTVCLTGLAAGCDKATAGTPRPSPPTKAPAKPAAPPAPKASTEPAPSNALEREVWQWAKESAPLYEPSESYQSATLETNSSHDMAAVLQEGRCARVYAVGEATLVDLELALIDPNGSLARQEILPGPRATLGVDHAVCPPRTAVYKIKATARKGSGAFAIRVFQSPY